MANFNSIPATGKSIERMLNAAFAQAPEPVPGKTTKAFLVRSEDFDRESLATIIVRPALSIFLYRVNFNKSMRAAWSAITHQDGRTHLPLDLHYLLTPWGDNAEAEAAVLGRAMQALDETPILSGPLLHQSGDWAPNEAVNLLLDEIETEAVMRTFDSLAADYRISVPYIARVVRLDGQRVSPAPNVSTLVTGKVPI
jgi:Pvc16 N-terminal domain